LNIYIGIIVAKFYSATGNNTKVLQAEEFLVFVCIWTSLFTTNGRRNKRRKKSGTSNKQTV